MALRAVVAADEFLHPDNAPPSSHDLLFVTAGDPQLLVEALRNADALIVRRTRVTEPLLLAAPRLRLIQQVGIGTDGIDLEAARRLGIPVANTPRAVTIAVVEHTFLLLLAAIRGFPQQNDRLRLGQWSTPQAWESTELAGSTLGIVGFGSIGRGIATRALAFDARVLVHTRSVPAHLPPAIQLADMETLLRESDSVVLAVPLTPETRGMIGSRQLATMKPTAVLVNVARGALVEEEPLVEVLRSGGLRAAALDVFAREPIPSDSPLRSLPNVVATPHYAGASRESRDRIWRQVMENLDRLACGQPVRNAVNL